MIEVTNLTKRYGNTNAIEDLNFTIEKGQVCGFLGPNGAGKSTTMNILTGYIAATEGSVVIDGHDILKEPREARSCIGYLPEQPPLYQDMTVREYLNFAAELKRIEKGKRAESVDASVDMLALKPVEDRMIKNLSKGYRQRVGFAQALLGFPEIIILDEPTVGLDPKQIIEIRDLIKELGKNHTVILSSHILSEVSEVCDHIMIISKGHLVASDTTENLMKQMQPSTSLMITAVADKKTAENILSGIEEVTDYTVSQPDGEGTVNIKVQYDSDRDMRVEIANAFSARGCTIIAMNAEKASLEDIFLELTADDEKTPSQIAAENAPELEGAVDEMLKENGYDEKPVEEGSAYGPGDAEADALSDFADELAGGRDQVRGKASYEVDGEPETSAHASDKDKGSGSAEETADDETENTGKDKTDDKTGEED